MYTLEKCWTKAFYISLRGFDRHKNDDIHQKYDVFKNIMFEALEQLQKAFYNNKNDLAEFTSR